MSTIFEMKKNKHLKFLVSSTRIYGIICVVVVGFFASVFVREKIYGKVRDISSTGIVLHLLNRFKTSGNISKQKQI